MKVYNVLKDSLGSCTAVLEENREPQDTKNPGTMRFPGLFLALCQELG